MRPLAYVASLSPAPTPQSCPILYEGEWVQSLDSRSRIPDSVKREDPARSSKCGGLGSCAFRAHSSRERSRRAARPAQLLCAPLLVAGEQSTDRSAFSRNRTLQPGPELLLC